MPPMTRSCPFPFKLGPLFTVLGHQWDRVIETGILGLVLLFGHSPAHKHVRATTKDHAQFLAVVCPIWVQEMHQWLIYWCAETTIYLTDQ